MSIASDLAVVLRNSPLITKSISGKTVTVHVGAIRQRDSAGSTVPRTPAIILTTLNHDNFLTIDNPASIATETRKATLDIDCRGATEEEADDIRFAVEKFLGDFEGTAEKSVIEAIDLNGIDDGEESPEGGKGLPTFVKTIDIDVIYRRV